LVSVIVAAAVVVGEEEERTERTARRCDTVGIKRVRMWRVVESWARVGVRRGWLVSVSGGCGG
jgi:hypothetical protein